MPKVTSVEPQKKNPHRFNIFLDGEFAFGADEDLVVEYRLVLGKELLKTDLEKLLFETEVGKLMERMYRLWNIRPRSEKEVRNYFRIKNLELKIKDKELIGDLAIELVIKKLKQKNLLNDEEFAREWVEARRKSKQKGIKAIRSELYQKGINKEIIESVINKQKEEYSERELAEEALRKKWKIWHTLPYLEKKKKAFEYLARKGFEFELVKEAVEAWMKLDINTESE